ncbi:MAG: intradiol ring-cleavage dioxygenase [Gemmataceae bacterium]
MSLHVPGRRLFLGSAAFSLAYFTTPGLFADALTRTPDQTEGPFYPDKMPLDTDNDLLVINDGITPAVGTIAHVTGRILDAKGDPVRNAVVEIWQCDHNGAYLHPGSSNGEKRDKHFQGFGRFLTGSTGEYYFRTIKPVPYPGRTPHIHFKIKVKGKKELATQLYIKGHPGNAKDRIFTSAGKAGMAALSADFSPVKGSKLGEVAAKWDAVLGVTPEA